MSVSTSAKPLPTTARILNNYALLLPGMAIGLILLILAILWSITLGAANITPDTVFQALLHFDSAQYSHVIIQTVRLPRVLSGVVVGAALAASGAMMQGLTRNPLADSGILGIQSGAAFAVVLTIIFLGNPPLSVYAVAAFIGAGIAATLVYAFASMGRSGATPLKLTLAGVILTAFASSFTTAILIRNRETLDKIRFWTAGSLSGREMPLLFQITPYLFVGLIGGMLISRQITTISLGDDVAKGLGQNTARVKVLAAVIIVLMAGGSVALTGPIGFVGLIVPHFVRVLVGVDYRWIIPYSAIFGGILVTVADVGARIVIRPQELPVGVVMAVLGAPFFIWLIRSRVKR